MRFRNLRSTLRRLVLAGLPAMRLMNGCCPANMGLLNEMEQVVVIDPRATAFASAVEACRVNDQECVELCRKVLAEQGTMVDEDLIFEECRLIDVAPDQSEVSMRYGYRNECVAGRRPAGLADGRSARAACAAGAWLAGAARLEGASVYAFTRLAAELRAARAPRSLIAGALRSAGEEIRHTAMMGALARRFGARPSAPVVAATPFRPLAEIAAENAAEGCVREGYGAAVATWQARAATDPAVRANLAIIAEDETRHAALSFAIDAWAKPRLTPAGRRHVEAARRRAVAELLDGPGERIDPRARALLGLPDARQARRLARAWLAASRAA